jgi:threonine/homoserine/homoserine lactone efflux protein
MNLAKVLPMTFVMIAGPQILSAIFLATSENWKRNSIAYISGAALSITALVSASYFFINGLKDEGASDEAIYVVILVLLLLAAIHTYAKREESEPPKWMGTLQTADAKFSFRLGFLLLGIFPTDILTSIAVGQSLANDGSPWWHSALFVGLTLFLLAIPMLALFAFGERAQTAIPKVRDWMNNNSWIVSEAVIGLFIALTISDLV